MHSEVRWATCYLELTLASLSGLTILPVRLLASEVRSKITHNAGFVIIKGVESLCALSGSSPPSLD